MLPHMEKDYHDGTEGEAVTAWLALGSNLGDRLLALDLAVRLLEATPGVVLERISPVYETKAQTRTADEVQPDYLNAVIAIKTTLAPEALLARCLDIELAAGRDRTRSFPWQARTLDVDVLAYGMETHRAEHLTIPHPRLGARRFVLRPWADLDPAWRWPEPYRASVAELLERCPDGDAPDRTPWSLPLPAREEGDENHEN
jgi:2-amino-4-hydroxy-6-hydroxymethyldihydropteridine diphosphokinase